MVLLITGTISPSRGMKNTALSNVEERLALYIKSIEFYIVKSPVKKIVFCENSNFKTKKLDFLFCKAKNYKKQFEYISFQGNEIEGNIHGKGYGDGEIINYALNNSFLLKADNYFIKLTGKRLILNSSFFKKIKENKAYFNRLYFSSPKMIDASIFACPIRLYEKYFKNACLDVSDDVGCWMENKYANIILENRIKTCNFPIYPRIEGVSGSCGKRIKDSFLKFCVKSFLYKLKLYSIR